MVEAQIIESGLEPANVTSESFFESGLYDSRFLSLDWQEYHAANALSDDPITIELPRIRSNGIYLLDKAILTLGVILRKSRPSAMNPGGEVPDDDSKTALSNNVLNSLFEKSEIRLNGTPVNTGNIKPSVFTFF